MYDPWDLDQASQPSAAEFATAEATIWHYMMKVIATEQKNQSDDSQPSDWQHAMLDHADDIQDFVTKALNKPTSKAITNSNQLVEQYAHNNMSMIERWLQQNTGTSVTPLKTSKPVKRVIVAGQRDASKYLTIARHNMSENTLKQFKQIINTATVDIRGGANKQQAIIHAAKQWSDQGIPALIDKAGRHWSPDVYVRTVINSAVNNATNDVQLHRYREYGVLVKVSAHAGCRPAHLQYQNHIYSLDGDTAKYPDFESSTGYGTVTGIGGINCRHHALPYVEGAKAINELNISSEANAQLYGLTQEQRAMERDVRKAKRRLDIAQQLGDPDEIRNASQLVSRRQKKLKTFTDYHELPRDYSRETVATRSAEDYNEARQRLAAQDLPNHAREVAPKVGSYAWDELNADQYNKHVAGAKAFENYRVGRKHPVSELTISPEISQQLIYDYGVNKQSDKRVVKFTANFIIGYFVDINGKRYPTKNGRISYRKGKGAHITPMRPS